MTIFQRTDTILHMRKWFGTLLAITLLQLTTAPPQSQFTRASIEGIVIRADNDQPITGAQLTVVNEEPQPAPATSPARGLVAGGRGGRGAPNGTPPQVAPVTTDTNGEFRFQSLEPGIYHIDLNANGFVRQRYGQRSINGYGIGTSIVLTAGQTFKAAPIRLTPTGSLRGRILDDNGRPANGVPIVVLGSIYGLPDLKTFQQIGAGTTNNRGEYRIDNIKPGRYYVAAGNRPDPPGFRGVSGQASSVSYAFSYFPGVNDVAQASPVDIRPGEDALADMTTSRQKLFSVRGRVVDSTGQMVSNLRQAQVSVSLNYSGFAGGTSSDSGRRYDPATGRFELFYVIPGSYVIQAHMFADNTASQVDQNTLPIAELPIVVQNSDLEDLVLTLTAPVTVPGKMTIDEAITANVSSYTGVRLTFRRMSHGAPINVGTSPVQQPVHADGTFQVVGMRAGEYLVSLYVPPTYFVKSFRFDGRDILGKPLEFSGTIGVGFDIVLSSKPGQVRGMVTDAMLKPVPGAQAVVVPLASEDRRTRADLYNYFITDQNGHFTISGITPGYYNLFAWEGIRPFGYFDPDFMKTQESKGKPILVGESSVVTADIQVIPVTP